ncbi:CTD-like phosphatase [Theileria orientalis strain Shintoku]|uniref:protein-serine/threonine phosphatase n=1 Tax=Theileria orientalis strain Shintoku TaxID=869250 RepID=J4C8F9_THEOR|nr:CTD-like phosphatase [Theileria orientalis strain Shintoku]PVC51692.1 CTD-like phosphatase [Theileria orientalis]BAM40718.1 CTD-like phosphatase [Theileria orientalis strain Shintoku]|eukprot:XP_009691019.1 CTD-like phosphatase [Theileria orientalis strain Shintoku]
MSRPRFTGEPVPPSPPGPTPKSESNRNFTGKAWVRRTRQRDGFNSAGSDWPNKPAPPKSPPIFKMVPGMPPVVPKQPVQLMHYYPSNPVVYPNMVMKDDKTDKNPKPKFPPPTYMGHMVGVPPPSYVSQFVPMSNVGVDAKPPVHDKYSKPVFRGPYYKEPPVHGIIYKDPPVHNPAYLGYVNLSQVKGFDMKRPKRNFETMSEISDEHESDSSAKEKSDSPNIGPLSTFDIKFFTPFLPKAPERYKAGYELHELKAFLPLGVKAYVKNMALDPKLSSGFETGPVRNGKLVLLLDLDNTLLHTASQSRLDMLDIDPGDFVDCLGDPELYRFTLPNFPNITYYMKLRPCIREFLQILSLYYEMSIYTNATKEYADVVISILDPDRSLFMDRIVARNSVDEKDLLKSASRLYPDLDPRFILAFDDRRDVWSDIPHKQVVRAEHYDFFESYLTELNNNYTSSGSDFNKANGEGSTNTSAPATHHLKSGNDYTFNVEQSESEPESSPEKVRIVDYDRHLKYMVRVFLEIHKRFFDDPFRNDVGAILESLQSQVLQGLGVLLTGYRKNAKASNSVLHADCEQRQKENLVEMGASVVLRLNDSKLTHIMAGKNCTDNITKSRDSQFNHVHKIHTLWLYSCRATFTKVDESLFDVDEVCNIYSNEPPQLPNKDHWRFLASATKADRLSSDSGYDSKGKDELPTRIFMGTGSYSNGTEVFSSVERIVIKWDPSKTKLLQNSIPDTTKHTSRRDKIESAPFTNAANPNKYAF